MHLPYTISDTTDRWFVRYICQRSLHHKEISNTNQILNEPIMALAGLYNPWTDPNTNTELYTFTIITTQPNPVVGAYHDREPVQLPRELEHSWLNPDFTEPEQIMPMLKTSSPDQMAS